MKRLFGFLTVCLMGSLNNPAIAAKISVVTGNGQPLRGEIYFPDTYDSNMRVTIDSIIVDAVNDRYNVILTGYHNNGDQVINSFTSIDCQKMVGTLDRVIANKNQLQALADIFSNKADMLDIMQGSQSYVVNAKIDFKRFQYQYPAVMQSIQNICNYKK